MMAKVPAQAQAFGSRLRIVEMDVWGRRCSISSNLRPHL